MQRGVESAVVRPAITRLEGSAATATRCLWTVVWALRKDPWNDVCVCASLCVCVSVFGFSGLRSLGQDLSQPAGRQGQCCGVSVEWSGSSASSLFVQCKLSWAKSSTTNATPEICLPRTTQVAFFTHDRCKPHEPPNVSDTVGRK